MQPANSHVHPLFAGILNGHAAVPAKAAALASGGVVQNFPRKSAAQLQCELQAELAEFDPQYEYCDDFNEWTKHAAKAARIADIRRQLAQGVEA